MHEAGERGRGLNLSGGLQLGGWRPRGGVSAFPPDQFPDSLFHSQQNLYHPIVVDFPVLHRAPYHTWCLLPTHRVSQLLHIIFMYIVGFTPFLAPARKHQGETDKLDWVGLQSIVSGVSHLRREASTFTRRA